MSRSGVCSFRYWRPTHSALVEIGLVRGRDVALPPHFHEEDQITFVLEGRRRFVIGDELTVLAPGQRVVIPAGTPHYSLSEPAEVICVNLYAAPGNATRDLAPLARGASWPSVREAAAHAGMSREGFSRWFKKVHGIPPHTFWHLEKLNEARRLLRSGQPIAAVAADTGFSDQSHLGRSFRRTFGVTPGHFRAELPGSHLF